MRGTPAKKKRLYDVFSAEENSGLDNSSVQERTESPQTGTPSRKRMTDGAGVPSPSPFRAPSGPSRQDKLLIDIVHGQITLESLCLAIVDTHEYQRLQFLKQLGTCHFVFRGATHSRFEHSLGVAHLAERFAKHLQSMQPSLDITDLDVLCIKVAGLCHDLGHGPFSHVFDGVFLRRMYPDGLPGVNGQSGGNWRHEDGSVRMLRHLIAENGIRVTDYGLGPTDLLFIEEVIAGTPPAQRQGRGPNKFFLYDIVNNLRSGLDVDKLDYFQRDAKMSCISGVNIDFSRFIKKARVLQAEPLSDKDSSSPRPAELMICYPEKMVSEAVSLFRTRFDMHKQVYVHQAVKEIEFMITDAMELADPYLRIEGTPSEICPDGQYRMSQAVHDMKALSNLDDGILHVIRASVDPTLRPAKELIERIFRRQLYRCVGRTSLRPGDVCLGKSEVEILREIVACSADNKGSSEGGMEDEGGGAALFEGCSLLEDDGYTNFSQDSDGGAFFFGEGAIQRPAVAASGAVRSGKRGELMVLEENDLIVEKMHVHYGMKAQNPVARMRFYPKNVPRAVTAERPYQAVALEERVYETDLPRSFEYRSVRVFCRYPEKNGAAIHAFETWCAKRDSHMPFPTYSQTGGHDC